MPKSCLQAGQERRIERDRERVRGGGGGGDADRGRKQKTKKQKRWLGPKVKLVLSI